MPLDANWSWFESSFQEPSDVAHLSKWQRGSGPSHSNKNEPTPIRCHCLCDPPYLDQYAIGFGLAPMVWRVPGSGKQLTGCLTNTQVTRRLDMGLAYIYQQVNRVL